MCSNPSMSGPHVIISYILTHIEPETNLLFWVIQYIVTLLLNIILPIIETVPVLIITITVARSSHNDHNS